MARFNRAEHRHYHGHLKDLRAVCRWLYDEGRLEVLPNLPQTLLPILTDEELGRIFTTAHLQPDTEINKRNRAIRFKFDVYTCSRNQVTHPCCCAQHVRAADTR